MMRDFKVFNYHNVGVFCVLLLLSSCCADHNFWHAPIHMKSNILPTVIDEVHISKVKSEESFKLNNKITKWKSVSIDSTSIAVGLNVYVEKSVSRFTIVKVHENQTFDNQTFALNGTALDFFITNSKENGILLTVATDSGEHRYDLHWFKINANLSVSLYWKVIIPSIYLNHVNLFDQNNRNFVIMSDLTQCVDIYVYSLKNFTSMFFQTIKLKQNLVRTEIYEVYNQINLKLVYENFEEIYRYENHFEKYITRNLSEYSGILEINLPYANLILAEKILHHQTHNSTTLEILSKVGMRIVQTEEMPCEYFGELQHGINCIVENEKVDGIKSAAIVQPGKKLVGILVPKKKSKTNLFWIEIEKKPRKNPIDNIVHDYKNRIKKLEERLQAQKSRIRESYKKSKRNVDGIEEIFERVDRIRGKIEKLKSVLSDDDEREKVIFKGAVTVLGKSNINHTRIDFLNNDNAQALINDIVLKNHIQPIASQKRFKNLRTIANVNAQRIDGIETSNMATKTNDELTLHGVLDVTQPDEHTFENVKLQTLNGMVLEEELIVPNRFYSDHIKLNELNVTNLEANTTNKLHLHKNYLNANVEDEKYDFNNHTFEQIYLPHNLTVETINGENLDEFLSKICLTNVKCVVPNTIKIDKISVRQSANVQKLNNLDFNKDFVFANAEKNSNDKVVTFSGSKRFEKVILVNNLEVKNLVNGIDTSKVITLNDEQLIADAVEFKNLTITEEFHPTNNITSTEFEKVLPNPTLATNETLITSNIIFDDLTIDGNIVIKNIFNDLNLDDTLNDIIYKNGPNHVDINSIKTFALGVTVQNSLNISSNKINEISLDDLIDKDSEQVLRVEELRGKVSFENVYVAGLIDDVNITKLEEETVKLSGEQYIDQHMFFEDGIRVDDLHVLESFNEITGLNEIEADLVVINGDFKGEINGFDLQEFDENRLSINRNQIIEEIIQIDQCIIDKNLSTLFVNGVNYMDLFDVPTFKASKLSSTKTIKNLSTSNIILNSIDGIPIENITKFCISSNESNPAADLIFANNLHFNKQIEIERLNDVDFRDFMSNLIYKNETNFKVYGVKNYLNGFDVSRLISASWINDIRIPNILRKTGQQIISSPVIINGSLRVDDLRVNKEFNGVDVDYVKSAFGVDENGDYIINNDAMMKMGYINKLEVESVNGMKVDDIFKNLISKDDRNITTNNDVIFMDNVQTESINVEKLNGENPSNIFENIIFINSENSVEIPLVFTNEVTTNTFESTTNTQATINGVNTKNWNEKAVFINQGIINERITFEDAEIVSNLKTQYLNEYNTSRFIPLKEAQDMEETLFVQDLRIFGTLKPMKFVNGLNLPDEYKNTVMNDRFVTINSSLRFVGNVLVNNNMQITSSLNNHDITKLINLNTRQNLTGDYVFLQKVGAENARVDGLVNRIDLNGWFERGFKRRNKFQIVESQWRCSRNLSFNADVVGNGRINDIPMKTVAFDVQRKYFYKNTIEKELKETYRNVCLNLNHALDYAKNQIQLFKYIEHEASFEFDANITNIIQFEYLKNTYLLISLSNCNSVLYMWTENMFELVEARIETGILRQVITVSSQNDRLYLVAISENDRKCGFSGTHVWKVEANNLQLAYKLDDYKLVEYSTKPQTFYAMNGDSIIQFYIEEILNTEEINVYEAKKWFVSTENAAFIPRGLNTGFAIRNGTHLTRLLRSNNIADSHDHYVEIGKTYSTENMILPGANFGEISVTQVGGLNLASIVNNLNKTDMIHIYKNVENRKLLKTLCDVHRPRSLVSITIGRESLLIFLEGTSNLVVYKYHGLYEFIKHSTTPIQAEKITKLHLPHTYYKIFNPYLGVVIGNKFSLFKIVTDGQSMNGNVQCVL